MESCETFLRRASLTLQPRRLSSSVLHLALLRFQSRASCHSGSDVCMLWSGCFALLLLVFMRGQGLAGPVFVPAFVPLDLFAPN